MLRSINISVTTYCGANCIFCPSERGKYIKQKMMSFEHLQKIIDELSTRDFQKDHAVNRIIFGENGGSFLNKDLIRMLRYTRLKIPNMRIILYTNFQHFTEEKARTIIKERLVDLVRTNIDGASKESYFITKQLDLNNVKQNLLCFVNLRKQYKVDIPIHISVLTLNNYIQTIYKNFGFFPSKIKDKKIIKIKDDYKAIKKYYSNVLNENDKITKSYLIVGWAERYKFDTNKINYKKYACPDLIRVKNEAFIAPDGTWYGCCLDSENQLKLGNVIEESINKIYFNSKRENFIKMLEKRKFEKIGGPCATVNCCQWMHRNMFISWFHRILFKQSKVVEFLYNYLGKNSL